MMQLEGQQNAQELSENIGSGLKIESDACSNV